MVTCPLKSTESTINKNGFKNRYLCFMNHATAFYMKCYEELFLKIKGRININGKDLRIKIKLYLNETTAMKLDGDVSECKPIKKGGR